MKKEEKKEKVQKKQINNEDDEIKIFENIKKMNVEHHKLICLYIIILILLYQTFQPQISKLFSSLNKKDNQQLVYDVSTFHEISASELENIASKDEVSIIYIGKSNCEFCLRFLPVLKQAQNEYRYITYYIDINRVSLEDKEKIIKYDNENNFVKTNFGATPMVMSVKNNKLVEAWVGYSEYPNFEQFLIKSGLKK